MIDTPTGQAAAGTFYTWQGLLSVGVAAGVVVMVAGGIRRLTGLSHPGIPFLIALIIALGGANSTHNLNITANVDGLFQIVIIVINAFLLFCTAMGGQDTLVEGAKGELTGAGETQSGKPKGWFDSWLH